MKLTKNTILILILIGFLQASCSAKVIKETVIIVDTDGEKGMSYSTLRSSNSRYSLWFEKTETLDDYLYIYPNNTTWDTTSEAEHNVLRIPGGNYATMTKSQPLELVTRSGSNYVWQDKTEKNKLGHFGNWNTPRDFDQFTHVWVLPDNLQFVDYKCNRQGQWVQRGNALAFFGEDMNDIVFTVRYSSRLASTSDSLSGLTGQLDGVTLTQEADGIKLILEEKLLFPSGSETLQAGGQSTLAKIANTLANRKNLHIIVEGHTDNTPIQGELRNRYPSNWELSAARALTVLRKLEEKLPKASLEARAFGSQRARASNATAAGRAQNRRIEILVTEK